MSENDKAGRRYFSLFPKTLAHCIEPLTRPVLKAQGLAGTRILTDWPSIVGDSLARHSFPEKLSLPPGKKTGGTLVISVENGFATELQHVQPVILERLAGYFGYQAVSRIAISHSWQARPEPEKPSIPKPSLPKDCHTMADHIEDIDLRDALQSLAKTLCGETT